MTAWPTPDGPTPPPMPPPPPPRIPGRRVALIIIGTVVVTAAATVGVVALVGGFSSGGPTFTLHGTLTLVPDREVPDVTFGNDCQGEGSYSDLTPGAAVTVADPQGHIVGTGTLQVGAGQEQPTGFNNCVMPFSVPHVPDGLSSYSVTISHRGTQVESPAAAHGSIDLSIGSN